MQKLRRRNSKNQVRFEPVVVKSDEVRKAKPAQRIGNHVRYGRTVFELHEDGKDSIYCTILEVITILLVVGLVYVSYYHYETMHFHVAKTYGHLGYASAQHVVGQRLLTGKGAEKNETEAMRWFKFAADQGHPEASFNLAVGHIHGEKTGLRRGQPTKLLQHAKKHGVDGADHALNLCARRGCDL